MVKKMAKKKGVKKAHKAVAKKGVKRTVKRRAHKAVSKKARVKKVPIGIKNLDRIIEGGFEKNSTNLVVGGSGSGKSRE